MIIVGVPPLEFWVLSMLQDVLLALEVGVVIADPGSTLHADRVHPENTQRLQKLHSLNFSLSDRKNQTLICLHNCSLVNVNIWTTCGFMSHDEDSWWFNMIYP